ncbi:MAG TPA: histidine phosphatase family protein [Hyphomicrobiaceae bacterium]|nr:histidine phosphatase family protein [Hyphomicrobiaceae bacterium]
MSSTKRTVYLVRHGQSEHNVAPVFQSPDAPLSPEGSRQAEYIAERISRLSFQALIASPFPRASKTAEAIARATGKQPELSELFVERLKPTRINGKPFTDAEADAVWRQWERSLYTPGLRVEDGENFDDLVARADAALAYLTARTEPALVVVTHGYFLRTVLARVLLGDLLNGELFRHLHGHASTENTGITVLKLRASHAEPPRWRLWTYNDHAHLG